MVNNGLWTLRASARLHTATLFHTWQLTKKKSLVTGRRLTCNKEAIQVHLMNRWSRSALNKSNSPTEGVDLQMVLTSLISSVSLRLFRMKRPSPSNWLAINSLWPLLVVITKMETIKRKLRFSTNPPDKILN
jgi:hypothetical protein